MQSGGETIVVISVVVVDVAVVVDVSHIVAVVSVRRTQPPIVTARK